METKNRLILRHIDTGLYLSWSPDNMPHTRKLSQARRFNSAEDIRIFYENSHYRPDDPGEYEMVDLEIEYRLKEVEPNEREHERL